MVKRYYEKDRNLELPEGKTVAIIGYGSQGHAHALNLRDRADVIVGCPRPARAWAKATAAGLKGEDRPRGGEGSQGTMLLVPDHIQGRSVPERNCSAWQRQDADVRPWLLRSISGQIKPPADVDVSMIAPEASWHQRARSVHRRVGVFPNAGCDPSESFGQSARDGIAYAPGSPGSKRE